MKTKQPNKQKYGQSFLHILSHQLRTPTYSVRDALDILYHSRKLPPDLKSVLVIARRKCSQLTKLLENLLKITDTKMEQITTKEHRALPLNNVLDELVKNNLLEAGLKDISMRTNYARTARFYLNSNKDLLEQALQNLISNAIQYTRPKTDITIKTKYLRPYLEISVKDKGLGIPKKEQLLIFTPFYRLQLAPTKNPEGTGLGLTIAQLFIKKMHGTIGVKSKRNKGSSFWVRLPTVKSPNRNNYIIGKDSK